MTITPQSSTVIPFPDLKSQKTATSKKLDWIDAVVADHSIDTRAKVVAICIMQHVNHEVGTAYVSDETIGDKTGTRRTLLVQARNDLRAAGWITWKRLPNKPNLYSTLTEPMAAIAEHQQKLKQQREERRMQRLRDVPPRGQPKPDDTNPVVQTGGQPVVQTSGLPVVQTGEHIPLSGNPLEEPLSKNISLSANQNGSGSKTAISKHSGSTPDFESFWQVYPKRVGRLQAEKKYAAAISSGISAEVLLAGAGRYAAERAGDDPRFTKHPATWLNGGCWMDEPQAPSKAATKSFDAFVVGARGFLNGGGDE